MNEDNLFPVQALNSNITTILKKIVSTDIYGNINAGLSNQIKFIDQGTHISNIAEIYKNIDDSCQVILSAAYCQYLWLLCDISIKSHDIKIVKQECQLNNMTIEDFIAGSQQFLCSTNVQHNTIFSSNSFCMHFADFLFRMKDLLSGDYMEQLALETELLLELSDPTKTIDNRKLEKINLKGKYEEKSNSVYCFGIAFILLHELSHFSLGHMNIAKEDIEDEVNADMAAFWNIYSDINDEEAISANCGILCALFSLMFLNHNLESDGVHPREDKRIFQVFDQIKDDTNKYADLLVYLFDYWGCHYKIPGYQITHEDSSIRIEKIRIFLENWPPSI